MKNSKIGPNFYREHFHLKQSLRCQPYTLFHSVACLFLFNLSQLTPILKNHEASLLQSKWLLDKWISLFHNSPSTGKYTQASLCCSVLFCFVMLYVHHTSPWYLIITQAWLLWQSLVCASFSSVCWPSNLIYPMSPDDSSLSILLVRVTFVRSHRS